MKNVQKNLAGGHGLREQRNHCLKYESDYLLTGIGIKIWIVEGFARDFYHPRCNPTEKFFSRISFQSRCVSHLKIANLHEGSIHWNVRIALQFSYQFAIFMPVCNFHISLQFSRFGVEFLRGRLQFSYGFAIFISVCNSHLTTPDFLRTAFIKIPM